MIVNLLKPESPPATYDPIGRFVFVFFLPRIYVISPNPILERFPSVPHHARRAPHHSFLPSAPSPSSSYLYPSLIPPTLPVLFCSFRTVDMISSPPHSLIPHTAHRTPHPPSPLPCKTTPLPAHAGALSVLFYRSICLCLWGALV